MLRRVVTLAVAVPLILWVLAQCRKPRGVLGRAVAWGMNQSHSAMTDWALNDVRVGPNDTILDIGCGGGRTVRTLAARSSQGTVCGLD